MTSSCEERESDEVTHGADVTQNAAQVGSLRPDMLAIAEPADASPTALAALSRSWDDVTGARLVVAAPTSTATVLGAFARRSAEDHVVRGSGGAPVTIGTGTIWIQLALERSDVLVDCRPDQLINRYVRPVLRTIGGTYLGRDVVSVRGQPVGLVSFAHDAGTGRCLFEALLAVTTPFSGPRPSFRGKEPTVLGGDVAALVTKLRGAYGPGASAPLSATSAEPPLAPPWTATLEEALGTLGADATKLGGELVASRDAVRDVEARLAAGASVDEALAAFEGAQLFGARIESLREVLLRAREGKG